jgi:hypothetical protein
LNQASAGSGHGAPRRDRQRGYRGHRDGFRALKNTATGDEIEVQSLEGTLRTA